MFATIFASSAVNAESGVVKTIAIVSYDSFLKFIHPEIIDSMVFGSIEEIFTFLFFKKICLEILNR